MTTTADVIAHAVNASAAASYGAAHALMQQAPFPEAAPRLDHCHASIGESVAQHVTSAEATGVDSILPASRRLHSECALHSADPTLHDTSSLLAAHATIDAASFQAATQASDAISAASEHTTATIAATIKVIPNHTIDQPPATPCTSTADPGVLVPFERGWLHLQFDMPAVM